MKKSVLKKDAVLHLKVSFEEFKELKKHETSVKNLIENSGSQKNNISTPVPTDEVVTS